MKDGVLTLERAFELARSGHVGSIPELRRALRHEGHNTKEILGPSLVSQLRGAIRAAGRRGYGRANEER